MSPAARLAFVSALSLSLAAVSAVAAEPSAGALRVRATQLFRAQQFSAACPLFESAVRLAPNELELLADLALCQHRNGNDEDARKTNLDVIRRASTPAARLSEPRFVRLRKHAYFNLAELDRSQPESELTALFDASEDEEESCAPLNETPGCLQKLYACGVHQAGAGAGGQSDTSTLRFALSEHAAHIGAGEGVEPYFKSAAGPARPVVIAGDSGLQIDVHRFSEFYDYTCDGAAEESEAACYKEHEAMSDDYDCVLAYHDACTGLLGVVCSGRHGADASKRPQAVEYRLDSAVVSEP